MRCAWLNGSLADRKVRSNSTGRVYEDKWNSVHLAALQSMTQDDNRIWGEIEISDGASMCVTPTPEQKAATGRYDEAFLVALTNHTPRFTISELDGLLAG